VRILGTDLSRRCVAAAKRAVYGRAAFRAVPPDYKQAYFEVDPEGTKVGGPIRSMCTFAQLNLLHPQKSSIVVGRMDAIFCRNVLIYLDASARMRVLDELYDRLAPGGFLMLGHSESLLNVSSRFEVVHLREDLVYRRPEGDGAPRFRAETRLLLHPCRRPPASRTRP
jgi:chemotaxis protein methyltransferase CheR